MPVVHVIRRDESNWYHEDNHTLHNTASSVLIVNPPKGESAGKYVYGLIAYGILTDDEIEAIAVRLFTGTPEERTMNVRSSIFLNTSLGYAAPWTTSDILRSMGDELEAEANARVDITLKLISASTNATVVTMLQAQGFTGTVTRVELLTFLDTMELIDGLDKIDAFLRERLISK